MSSSRRTGETCAAQGTTALRLEAVAKLDRDYTTQDVAKVMDILLRHGEFGSTQEAARRMASICAHEILAALTP